MDSKTKNEKIKEIIDIDNEKISENFTRWQRLQFFIKEEITLKEKSKF